MRNKTGNVPVPAVDVEADLPVLKAVNRRLIGGYAGYGQVPPDKRRKEPEERPLGFRAVFGKHRFEHIS